MSSLSDTSKSKRPAEDVAPAPAPTGQATANYSATATTTTTVFLDSMPLLLHKRGQR